MGNVVLVSDGQYADLYSPDGKRIARLKGGRHELKGKGIFFVRGSNGKILKVMVR